MFRSWGSVLCVVVMAAFVFGCGGGKSKPSVDPGPTDEQRIAQARQEIASILSTARTQAQAASSAASSIQANADATAAQIASAASSNTAAQAALKLIESASSTASAATTPAAAQTALESAKTAQGDLNTAATAITSIQNALQAIADDRNQRKADDLALTGGSSLIKHLRANKLVYDAVLTALGGSDKANNIEVGPTTGGNNGNNAEYPYYEDRTVVKKVSGVRKVNAQGETSTSKTTTLTGPATFRYGFDLKGDNNKFVNAYTDIQKEKRVRNSVPSDDTSTPQDERYDHNPDADYLLLGTWLAGASGSERVKAFAYGSQPLNTSGFTFCGPGDSADTSTLERVCTEPTSLTTITGFVGADKDVTATYKGDANGTYLADGKASYFDADVELRAEFVNKNGTGSGSIEGEVKNIKAGGESISGSIDFIRHMLVDDISGEFLKNNVKPTAAGVIEGESYQGQWTGQFFGFRATKSSSTTRQADPGNNVLRQVTTTYSAEAPGSVAGSFYVVKETAPAGDAALIGAFGAHR